MDPFDTDSDRAGDAAEPLDDEGVYVCQACGEEIVVPVDVSMGEEQVYSEDCPVCCRPHLLRVQWDGAGWRIDAEAE